MDLQFRKRGAPVALVYSCGPWCMAGHWRVRPDSSDVE